MHLSTAGGPWLVAMRSMRGASAVDGVSELYFAALAHALNAAVGVEASRLTRAVMQQFVAGESASQAASRAVSEVSSALTAEGHFAVFRPDGSSILAAGARAEPTADGSAVIDGATLRAPVDAPAPFVAVLEMRALTGRVFTQRDVKLFESACGAFNMWLPPVLRQARLGAERRGSVSSFDETLDRYAREAYASGNAASLIVIGGHEVMISPQAAQGWIRRLRPELRPTDLAGRLRSGEVGILLLQTPHDGAHVVGRRLAGVFQSAAAGEEPAVRIGVASQVEAVVSADALIDKARNQPIEDEAARG
jgi:hypothetical protein